MLGTFAGGWSSWLALAPHVTKIPFVSEHKKAENGCETICLTESGLERFLLNQSLPEHSEKKRSRRAIGIEDRVSSYCTGKQSQDFVSTFQEGLRGRVVNIYQDNENHPARQLTGG